MKKWILGASIIGAIVMGWVVMMTVPPSVAASIDDPSFKFLPPETQGVAFIDVAALWNAPFVKDVLKDNPPDFPKELNKLKDVAGFDPQRDLDKITIGKVGDRSVLVIAQGRIDKFKMEQYLKDEGQQQIEVYLGQTLYQDHDGAFAIFNNLAFMGTIDAVKKGIDQMQLPGSAPLRSDLLAAIQTIEPGNQVWAVGDLSVNDLQAAGIRGPAPAVDMMKSIKTGTFQLRVDTGIHARATGNFADVESAKNVVDLGRGAIALFRLQMAKQQAQGSVEVVQLLDGIDISNSGATLTLKVDESGELLKKLKDLRSIVR